jgi:Flp pilus assembly protein CpaB
MLGGEAVANLKSKRSCVSVDSKRMNTARIVVLIIALGAGGVAAYLVSGSDNKPPPTAPVAQLQTVDVLVAKSDIGLGQTVAPEDMQWQTWPEQAETLARAHQTGTLSLALRSIVDVNMAGNISDDQAPKRRGESINVVRYGVPSSTTTQK